MSSNNDLERFRREWKEEVIRRGNPSQSASRGRLEATKSDTLDNQPATSSSHQTVLEKLSPSPTKRNAFQPFMIADKLLEGQSGKDILSGSSVTSSAGDGSIDPEEYFRQKPKKLRLESEDKEKIVESTKPKSFLDIFLNDLNEITEIPFFDLQMPREVAIRIFKYLDAVDLCRCSQVSKAWQALAEDELLWCEICHTLGYDESTLTAEKRDWKLVVKQHVRRERQRQLNWKTRIGEVRELQYVRGGVICAASSYKTHVASGYSNGELKRWDIDSGEEITLQPSSQALVIDEQRDSGTVANIPTHIALNRNYTAAAYSQGYVDIWACSSPSTQPVYSYNLKTKMEISAVESSETLPLFAVSYGHKVRVDGMGEDGCIQLLHEIYIENETKIRCMKLHPRASDRIATSEITLLSAGDKVTAHVPDESEGISVLHHTVGQTAHHIDSRDGQVIISLTDRDFMGGFDQHGVHVGSHKLKLVCLHTGAEVQQFGPTPCQPVCVEMQSAPSNMLITGSFDRRMRVYDTRLSEPVLTLCGAASCVNTAQMDDVKVVSGTEDGLVAVWDQRMARKMWDLHNRHPVKFSRFLDEHLIWANIPYNKFPSDDFDNMTHRRNRGSLHTYNFSTNQETVGVPEICQSTFDEPERYNYNVRLAVPYDTVS